MKRCSLTILIAIVSFYQYAQIKTGAQQTTKYFPLLKEKNIALVVNQTSTIGSTHLVDTLLTANFSIKKVFAPEHGFRGTADAGEHVKNQTDKKTGISIIFTLRKKQETQP